MVGGLVFVVPPEAFPCQHDNVNEREKKDIMGP